MKVVILGSGGREHALAHAIKKSPLLRELIVAPGNPGIGALARLAPLDPMDIAAVTAFCKAEAVDLVVVEDFKLLPGKARAVSQKASRTVDAARGIGAADLWARQRGVELIYRDPSHWRIGLQLAGIEPSRWPKQHKDGHSMCAYGAGFHALVELGLVQSRLGALQ